jgi:hypothetical protein
LNLATPVQIPRGTSLKNTAGYTAAYGINC